MSKTPKNTIFFGLGVKNPANVRWVMSKHGSNDAHSDELHPPVFSLFCCTHLKSEKVTKVYSRNRLSKNLIMSCLSSLNDDNIVMPIRKWPHM